MPSNRSGRGLARLGVLTAALALAALCAPTAFADTPTTSPAPSTTTSTPAPTTATTPPAQSSTNAPASTTTVTTSPAPATGPSGPASAPTGAATDQPHLTVHVSIPGGPYLVGDEVPVKVTIANTGTKQVDGVAAIQTVRSGTFFSIDHWDGLPLWQMNPPISFGPGVSREFNLTGNISGWNGTAPTIYFDIMVGKSGQPAAVSNEVTVPVAPTKAPATVSGILFGDKDNSGVYHKGDELAGATVELSGPAVQNWGVTTTTGSDGRFSFPNLSAGVYQLRSNRLPNGWVIGGTTVRVDGSGKPVEQNLAAHRPLSETLSAAIAFDRDSYHPGDTVHVHITLTNKGTAPISGITANCNREGPESYTLGEPYNFGDITTPRGATIDAGATRTFDGTGAVKEHADDFGFVVLGCDFGSPDLMGNPIATAMARVPGKIGDTWGRIYYDKNNDYRIDPGEEITGTKVGLVDVLTGTVVARQVSDKTGRVDFHGVPAGLYEVRVFGPWAPLSGHPYYVPVISTGSPAWDLRMKPGPNVPDTDSVPPTPVSQLPIKDIMATHPAAAAPAKPAGLASTGANVIGLSIAGLATLALGAGVVLYARRRRALG